MTSLASKELSSLQQTQQQNGSHDKSENNTQNTWKKLFDDNVDNDGPCVEEFARETFKCKPGKCILFFTNFAHFFKNLLVIPQDSVFSLRDVDKKVFVPLSALSKFKKCTTFQLIYMSFFFVKKGDAFTGTPKPILMGSGRHKNKDTTPHSRPFDEFAVGPDTGSDTYSKTDGSDS